LTSLTRAVVLALSLVTAGSAFSQCRESELAVGLVLPDGHLLRNARPEQLLGESSAKKIPLLGMSVDNGPRRIVFVMDLSRTLSLDARRLEVRFLQHYMQTARSGDSFGLRTLGGKHNFEVGTQTEILTSFLAEVEKGLTEPHGDVGAYETVADAAKSFSPPALGNAIVLLTGEIEGSHRTRFGDAQAILWARQVRLFAVSLSPLYVGEFDTTFGGVGRDWYMVTGFVGNRETLEDLAWGSGGFSIIRPTDRPHQSFQLTDVAIKTTESDADIIRRSIDEFYRLRLNLNTSDSRVHSWKLDLVPDLRKKLPQASVLYPAEIPICKP